MFILSDRRLSNVVKVSELYEVFSNDAFMGRIPMLLLQKQESFAVGSKAYINNLSTIVGDSALLLIFAKID